MIVRDLWVRRSPTSISKTRPAGATPNLPLSEPAPGGQAAPPEFAPSHRGLVQWPLILPGRRLNNQLNILNQEAGDVNG
jgi:hypothetical protein